MYIVVNKRIIFRYNILQRIIIKGSWFFNPHLTNQIKVTEMSESLHKFLPLCLLSVVFNIIIQLIESSIQIFMLNKYLLNIIPYHITPTKRVIIFSDFIRPYIWHVVVFM